MMDFNMLRYVLRLSCEYTNKLEIKFKNTDVNLFDISKYDYLTINTVQIEIDDYNYIKLEREIGSERRIILTLYTYDDYGDSGMDLTYQTQIITELLSLETFMLS